MQKNGLGEQSKGRTQPASPLAISLVVALIAASIVGSLPGGFSVAQGFFGGLAISLLTIYGSALIVSYVRTQQEREHATEEARGQRELALQKERAQDQALEAYLDQISQLLTDEYRPLQQSRRGDSPSTVARARTLTVLPRLDSERKASVLTFLYESELIKKQSELSYLKGADLRGAKLFKANLGGVNLKGADLRGADLRGAGLQEANLSDTDLRDADLREADLRGADLSNALLLNAFLSEADLQSANLTEADLQTAYLYRANLRGASLRAANLYEANLHGAKVTDEQLSVAQSLRYAIMPDGSKHD